MNLLDELLAALTIIGKNTNAEYDETQSLPVNERVEKGVTMVGLKVDFEFYDYKPNQWCPDLSAGYKFVKRAKLTCQNNISKFREGSSVILSNGSVNLKMEISEDSIDNFILEPNEYDVKHCYLDTNQTFGDNWIIDQAKINIKGKLLIAVANRLLKNRTKREELTELFEGKSPLSKVGSHQYLSLNKSQNEAVVDALESSYFAIIQGPPGTGKTETIAHIAKELCNQGKKVFVTANTHTAINNCLNAISRKVNDHSKVLKIGEKHSSYEIIDNPKVSRKTRLTRMTYESGRDGFSQNGFIVGATAFGACYPESKRLDGWKFDVLIIDEAAQLSMPLALAAMTICDKFIFVGDHMQLPPIIPHGTSNFLLSGSVFKKLVDLYPSKINLLRTSYRLNEDLIRIPNQLFYNNQLTTSDTTLISDKKYSVNEYEQVLNSPDSHVLYLHEVFDSFGRSPHEASIVASLVNGLLANRVSISDIAVITPYRAQVREIRRQMNQVIPGSDDKIFMDTTERMQGQERDYIIYSMSNSHPLESKRRLDFFYNPNRLNVAITRAKVKCIVIANFKVFDIAEDTLSGFPESSKIIEGLRVFSNYYNLATKIKEEKEEDLSW